MMEVPQQVSDGEWEVPSAQQVKQALLLLGRPERLRAFYGGLDNPRWIVPLAEAGVLATAPGPVRTDDQFVQYPIWVEGQYLARMAPFAPGDVVAVLLQADTNGNPSAWRAIVDAAIAMPVEHAVRLADLIARYVTSEHHEWLDPLNLVALLEHLGLAPSPRAMSILANAMYGVRAPVQEDNNPPGFREMRLGLQDYWYHETLPRAFAAMQSRMGLNATRDLVRWLASWQLLSAYVAPDLNDLSYFWRPSIAGAAAEPAMHPIGDGLVEVLRDALFDALATGGATLEEIRKIPEGGGQRVFDRIEYHVIAKALRDDLDVTGVVERAHYLLFEEESLDLGVRHEFAELARALLSKGGDDLAAELAAHIRGFQGVDDATLRERIAGDRDPIAVTDDELSAVRDDARHRILAAIGDPLPGKLGEYARELDERFGPRSDEPEDTPFHVQSGPIGPNSPLALEQLREMTPDQVADYLRTWVPPTEQTFPPGASPEGLARQLSQLIQEDPNRFVGTAVLSVDGVDPTYVRGLLDGFEHAARNGLEVPWQAALAFAAEAAAMEDTSDDPVGQMLFRDGSWRWTHSQAAAVIGSALRQSGTLGADELSAAWAAIGSLAESPDPTPETEAGWNMNPMDLSLNVVRGKAMRSTMDLIARQSAGGALDISDSRVTEVIELLDRHLDPAIEQSIAVRSVYGEHFYLLLRALPDWTAANCARIFGPPDGTDRLGNAAWSSFLARHEPNAELLDLLRDQYVGRVAIIGNAGEPTSSTRDFEQGAGRLAEHVFLLYIWGVIPIDEPGGLERTLLDTAPAELLSKSLGHLGWRLFRTQGDLGAELIERFALLWDDRATAVADGRADPLLLREFGWWLRSHRFPVQWSLERMLQVAKAPNRVDMQEVLGRDLRTYAASHTRLTLEIFKGLLAQSEDGFVSHRLLVHAAPALGIALDSGDPDLVGAARELMNKFTEAGHSNVRETVRELQNQPDDELD